MLRPLIRSAVPMLLWSVSAVLLPAADIDGRIALILSGVPRGGLAGVAITDLMTGERCVVHNAAQPLSLASTTKALVAAATLSQFGPAFQLKTRVLALGPVKNGAIPGIGIIGGGDPCLDGHFSDDEPERIFAGWAELLKRQGITRIEGDIVIDGRLFSGPIRPATYPQDQDNLQRWYSAPASAFAWNDNCIEVRVVPNRVGQPANVEVRPRSARITVDNRARSIAGTGDKAIYVTRALDDNTVTVTGNYSQATPWFPLAINQDPELLAGDQVRASLIQAGITVSGQVRLGPVDPRNPLLVEQANPLVPALTVMCQHSQNFYGEQFLRLLGFQRYREGSIAAGSKAISEALTRLIGPVAAEINVIDGSGLSYGNQGSAGAMCAVMVAMHKSPYQQSFYDSLKVKDVGRAKGRVKTGTLAIATCLVGYIDPASGGRYAFALLFNRGESRDFGWAPKIREQIYRVMAE